MNKLLLTILLLTGCSREYECDVMMYYTDTGEIRGISGGEGGSYHASNTYGLTWPDGEKEAEAMCEEAYGDYIGTNEMGEVESTFDSCECH